MGRQRTRYQTRSQRPDGAIPQGKIMHRAATAGGPVDRGIVDGDEPRIVEKVVSPSR